MPLKAVKLLMVVELGVSRSGREEVTPHGVFVSRSCLFPLFFVGSFSQSAQVQ